MLPIISEGIQSRRVSIYSRNDNAKHPARGVDLTNSTSLQLLPGPMTVFDAPLMNTPSPAFPSAAVPAAIATMLARPGTSVRLPATVPGTSVPPLATVPSVISRQLSKATGGRFVSCVQLPTEGGRDWETVGAGGSRLLSALQAQGRFSVQGNPLSAADPPCESAAGAFAFANSRFQFINLQVGSTRLSFPA